MLNPSYLIQSRHNVYYFRYPLGNKRLCVSLKTRCPKEALRLAKLLEYHSTQLTKNIDWGSMDHADIMAMFRAYYAEVLERSKAKIDKEGLLPKQNVAMPPCRSNMSVGSNSCRKMPPICSLGRAASPASLWDAVPASPVFHQGGKRAGP